MTADPERVDVAELQKLGLYDPSWPHAGDLLELLHFLIGLGATIDDLLEYQWELPAVASVLALRPGKERLTGAEVAQRAGVSEELATRLHRATGFAELPEDVRTFSEADVAMLQTLQAGIALFGEEAIVQLARVIGSSMAKIADALVSSFLVNIEVPIVTKDPVGIDLQPRVRPRVRTPIRSVPVTCHREVCCPSSWASPMRIPSGPRM